jgi:hypothetical protein
MHKRRHHEVTGLPGDATKKDLLETIDKTSRRIMNIIARSNISTEEKEDLANLFLFILNVLDIEHAKIEYEKVKPVQAARGPKTLSKK